MTSPPDPYGQAALMLCEALALLLIEEGILSKTRVVEAVDGVIEVKQDMAGTIEDPMVAMTAASLLQDISRSIAVAPAADAMPGH